MAANETGLSEHAPYLKPLKIAVPMQFSLYTGSRDPL